MDEPATTGVTPEVAGGPMFSHSGLAEPASWAVPSNVNPLQAADAPGLGGPLVPAKEASPRLGGELFGRLLSYGTPQETRQGDVLFRPGDADVDLIVVAEGLVEVIRAETAAVLAEVTAVVGAGGFVGELYLVTGQNVYLQCRSEVTRLDGGDFLEEVSITDRAAGATGAHPCAGLFCFIGAEPATDWLTGVAAASDGFIRTDVQLAGDDLGPAWAGIGRRPLSFETSIPGVFAVGDVRSGSMKRVAAATGEGASAIASVHQALTSFV